MAQQNQLRWRPTNAPLASSRTDDIWFVDPIQGWAVNSNGQILKTDDGGANWVQQHLAGEYLRCIAFATPSRGWVGTLGPASLNRLYETRDGGGSWSAVQTLPPNALDAICGISVVSPSTVYLSGTNFPYFPARMMKTNDGGETWTVRDMDEHATLLVDTFFFSAERGFVVGGKADPGVPSPNRDDVKPVVLWTDDGGQTWTDRLSGQHNEFPYGEWGWKIFFVNESVGYISLENFSAGAILKTTDGGQTWERKEINDEQKNRDLEGIGFVDEQLGWVGGWGHRPEGERPTGFSSETRNGGETWHNANEIGRFLNRFRFFHVPEVVGYSSGDTVYKYSAEAAAAPLAAAAPPQPRLLDSAEPMESDRPVEITFNVPSGTQRLRIDFWDRFGQHVRRLVDESNPQTGLRSARWECRDDAGQPLSPQFYIYRITADDIAESRIVRVRT